MKRSEKAKKANSSDGQLISIEPRAITPKGLNKSAAPNIDQIKKYMFADEFDNLKLLDKIKLTLPQKPILLYPGCGADVLFPFFYMEHFGAEELTCIFVDIQNTLSELTTVLDEIGISFAQEKHTLHFYWNGMLVHLEFRKANIFEIIPKLTYNIYFERAFRIMKSQYEEYETVVFNNLNKNGIIVSDSGFQQCNFKRIKVPPELSAYHEMVIGVKE